MLFAQTVLPENPVLTKVGGTDASGDYRFMVQVKDQNGDYQYQTFTPDPDPSDTDADMGAWRVEVTAPTASGREHFLHILSVADNDVALAEPGVQNLSSASTAVALLGGAQVVAFSKSDLPATAADWEMPDNTIGNYLVTGLAPDTGFDAHLEGTGSATLPWRAVVTQSASGAHFSSSEGVLVLLGTMPLDTDADGHLDSHDNCPATANPDQADRDGDGAGDACDPDRDGDSFENTADCAPDDAGIYPGALETSFDGIDQNCDGGDATIAVPQAGYSSRKGGILEVEATSSLGQAANLSVDGYPGMRWSKKQGGRWKLKAQGIGANPGTIRISGTEGTIEAAVTGN